MRTWPLDGTLTWRKGAACVRVLTDVAELKEKREKDGEHLHADEHGGDPQGARRRHRDELRTKRRRDEDEEKG